MMLPVIAVNIFGLIQLKQCRKGSVTYWLSYVLNCTDVASGVCFQIPFYDTGINEFFCDFL